MKTWKEYFFELILFFAAVSAGFWVDNYREEQGEKEVLKESLQGFINEYELVIGFLESYDYYVEMHLAERKKAFQVFSKPSVSEEELKDGLSNIFNIPLLATDPLDDLVKFSSIMEADYSRFLEGDTLKILLLNLNDELDELEKLEQRSREIDRDIQNLYAKYQMIPDMISRSIPTLEQDSIPLNYLLNQPIDTSLFRPRIKFLFGEDTDQYREIGDFQGLANDPALKQLIQKIYVLEFDSQIARDRILIQSINEVYKYVKKELNQM